MERPTVAWGAERWEGLLLVGGGGQRDGQAYFTGGVAERWGGRL